MRARRAPLVEILYFDGCPIRLVNVPDQEAARRMRFLGSTTVRVDGRDVDPNTEERSDYALACRVFRIDTGIVGQPDERWIRTALLESGR